MVPFGGESGTRCHLDDLSWWIRGDKVVVIGVADDVVRLNIRDRLRRRPVSDVSVSQVIMYSHC